MSDVKITGMRRIMDPKPNTSGFKILAFFECETAEFNLRGCAFVRTGRGGITIWPPKVQAPDDPRRTITFRSDALRKAMLAAAQETYRALGGTDGEFPGREEERSPEPASPWDDPSFSLGGPSTPETDSLRQFLGQ